ncbi:hypothetical protein M409DRAFT_20066 [Zasmidium cellare ATCC 36951]|uniref:Ig-like domain-containing protein n=1 Tax=Zasmidium cellare ATCC 36951 TaxID=1080233 RepID=A0A6A6CSH3_ZASCE|nr:uncharacterized protein M409DRAFT_20066 [Zasmidium cellare ATCC 36951]KAF2169653.1 hypothetical protein M409DRAFT_20066 [Zasmidium cellare ATCC 36951]
MKLLPVTAHVAVFLVLTSAKPIWPVDKPRTHILKAFQSLQDSQQLLLAPPDTSIPPPQRVLEPQSPNYRFEAQENSVGVLLTDKTGEVKHFWVPLGRRVYTRDAPTLPVHPLTARITTLINTSPQLANPEKLDQIQCEVWTHSLQSTRRGKRIEQRSFSFAREDGLIRFADEESPFWLRGQEVESYVCS